MNRIRRVTAWAAAVLLLLAVLYFVISLPITLLVDRVVLKRPGYAGASMCSMSAVSIIMPAAVAAVVPSYAEFADTAAAQIALAVAITCSSSLAYLRLMNEGQ